MGLNLTITSVTARVLPENVTYFMRGSITVPALQVWIQPKKGKCVNDFKVTKLMIPNSKNSSYKVSSPWYFTIPRYIIRLYSQSGSDLDCG